METNELGPAIEEIRRAVGNEMSETEIKKELEKYLNDYHTNLQSAVRGIIRKFQSKDDAFATAENPFKKISNITGSESVVDVVAKVVFVSEKNVTIRGSSKTIISGILGDDSGTISFTVWEPGSVRLEKGGVYCFRNCYCKLWNGKAQLNIGNRGRIEPVSGQDFDVPERELPPPKDVKISEIREGIGNISVVGKIVSVETRNISRDGNEKTVFSGIMADETGKIQFSAWKDFGLVAGTTVSAKNCYVRVWKGIPQLNMSERAEVEIVEKSVEANTGNVPKTVKEILEVGGGLDFTVEGTVIDIKSGTGVIEKCAECNRTMTDKMCPTHGACESVNDLRVRTTVDDGTGTISAVFYGSKAEMLCGTTVSAAGGLAATRGNDVLRKELAKTTVFRKVRISGNVTNDEFGPSMVVKNVELIDTDLKERAKKILAAVEGKL